MYFTYDLSSKTFAATGDNPTYPIGWLNFVGRWGDEQYPSGTHGQYSLFGQAHYETGPTGPRDKGLDRTMVCNGGSNCTIYDRLVEKRELTEE